MELINSTINETWKLCTIGGFLGFFVLAVFLTTNPQTHVELSSARSSTVITFVSTTTETTTTTAPELKFHNLTTTNVVVVPAAVNNNNNTTGENGNFSTAVKNTTGGNENSPAAVNSTPPHPAESPTTTSTTITISPLPSHHIDSTTTLTQPPVVSTTISTIDQVYDLDNAAEVAADAAISSSPTPPQEKQQNNNTKTRCNIFEGRWVYRPNKSPMYSVYQCPFLEDKMSCRRNGRPDSEYEGWSWEPNDCSDIPLFNGKDMLERMRGKRMLIAGDSLNRNMWESLACLFYTAIKGGGGGHSDSDDRVFVDAAGSMYKVLKAKEYDFTLEFYWCPFLIELEERNKHKKILNLDKLVPSSEKWRGADVMVFDSGHWWTHRDKWDVFHYKGKTIQDMPMETAYKLGLTTWRNWITSNTDPAKTTVFFRSISPEHKGKQWCFNATTPIADESYVNIFPKSMIQVVEESLSESRESIRYLNITRLSGYRRDAHPAMYRYEEWKWKVLTKKYMRLVPRQADCSHWCLPGLPDTWNRLLYVSLFHYGEDGFKIIGD